jgi:DNA-binding LacI/PurR family transcriptional regulator
MTVSNFVRGKSVALKTSQKVERAIARLNYRPNLSARSLRLSEQFSVGIVIADTDPAFLNDPFISRLVSGLSNHLSKLDYTLDVQGVAPERFDRATILTKAANAALCAILSGTPAQRQRQLQHLTSLGQPVVVFQEVIDPQTNHLAVVAQDDFSGGKQLGDHLAAQGVRRVLFVRPALDWCAIEQREQGLRAASKKRAHRMEVRTVICASEHFDDVNAVVSEQLARTHPHAIVAATDSMAAAALKACESAGRRIPANILLAGFNGFDVWRYVQPALTTVISPAYELGQRAGELLLERLKTGVFSVRKVLLPVKLQVSGSTGARSDPAT